jgi:hypothetical protein
VARREGISRNEALVRLAELGVAQHQRLEAVADRADRRLSAWRARSRTPGGRHATADELEAAVALARGDEVEETR